VLVFPTSHHHVFVAFASQYLELVTVLDYSSYSSSQSSRPKLTKVKLHGNNVCDVIIAHVISGDAPTHKQTTKQTDMEIVKQS